MVENLAVSFNVLNRYEVEDAHRVDIARFGGLASRIASCNPMNQTLSPKALVQTLE